MRELSGKVALVTGAGRGLGEAVSFTLSEAGATVVAADIREDLARCVAERLEAAGGRSLAIALDVTDADQVEQLVPQVADRLGRLDFLINNAGVDVTLPIDELTIAEWDRVIGVNLRGPFVMSRAAIPVMRKQGAGHIVNIVSTAAKRAWPNASAYHASKWGLLGFSQALWTEVREYGLKATAVIAGGMRTPFLLDRFPDIDPGVLQEPRNVAETVRFILSQPAETIIPEVLVIPMKETSWP